MFLFHDCLAGKEEEAGRVRQAGRQGGGTESRVYLEQYSVQGTVQNI